MNAGRTSSPAAGEGMRLAIAFFALLCTVVAAFALTFPPLTGRIVDQANIVTSDARRAIEPKLADLETKSTDQLVVVTALPSIHRDFGGSLGTLQWTVSAYNTTYAAGILTAAALGDRLGRRRVFLGGLVLFTLASAVCALAPNTLPYQAWLWAIAFSGRKKCTCLLRIGSFWSLSS